MKYLFLSALFLLPHIPLFAQTIDDGRMMGKGLLCAGYMFTTDSWDEYWEGKLKRKNGNLGTVTTNTHQMFANLGVTSKLNFITTIPHVDTNASQGVLASMSGWQDATLALKYKFFETPFTELGTFRTIAVVSASLPMTNYPADFLPLSIGLQSRRISTRLTNHFRARKGWFATGTAAYSWRSDVPLDRPYFYTNGKLTFSDHVPMPNVFDYTLSGGYTRRELVLSSSFSQQRVQGGGDIRRQDMPFVSNRMNYSRAGVYAKVPLPKYEPVSIVAAYSYILDGRNVGQSSTFTIGMTYLVRLWGKGN